MLDNIQRFIFNVRCSLHAGTVRSFKFCVEFRLDVFRYLFKDSGITATRGKKYYALTDFSSEFFFDEWYVVYDKYGNGCMIDFPVEVTPKIRYGPRQYKKNSDSTAVEKPRMFREIVCVTLVKKRC